MILHSTKLKWLSQPLKGNVLCEKVIWLKIHWQKCNIGLVRNNERSIICFPYSLHLQISMNKHQNPK